jgi:uncharacterized integral membrane protein
VVALSDDCRPSQRQIPLLGSPLMADPTPSPGVEVRREGTNWRQWALWIAILLIAIIAVQNSQEVDVDFLFVNTTAPLIVALLLAAVLGAAVGYLAPVLRRHRRAERRREED